MEANQIELMKKDYEPIYKVCLMMGYDPENNEFYKEVANSLDTDTSLKDEEKEVLKMLFRIFMMIGWIDCKNSK